jgi:hypothetical protein
MTKTDQSVETMKTSFLFNEYDQLILDLDFIVASLQVATEHDSEVFDASPIFSEALTRAIASRALIKKIHPERKAA